MLFSYIYAHILKQSILLQISCFYILAEELQCLAVWNDGRNKYLVGTLKGRSISSAEKMYRYAWFDRPHIEFKI